MQVQSNRTVFVPAPAALLALAVAMPLAAAGEATTSAPGPDRGQTLARCLTQAARQFCGEPADLTMAPAPDATAPHAGPALVPAAGDEPRPYSTPLLPQTIDLPPPALR